MKRAEEIKIRTLPGRTNSGENSLSVSTLLAGQKVWSASFNFNCTRRILRKTSQVRSLVIETFTHRNHTRKLSSCTNTTTQRHIIWYLRAMWSVCPPHNQNSSLTQPCHFWMSLILRTFRSDSTLVDLRLLLHDAQPSLIQHEHGFYYDGDPLTPGHAMDTPIYCSPKPHDWIWRHYHVTSLAQLFSSLHPSFITTPHKPFSPARSLFLTPHSNGVLNWLSFKDQVSFKWNFLLCCQSPLKAHW